jgi:hypothetical protein
MDATLEVCVEVESIRGYHLVFAPEPNNYRESKALRGWLGYSKDGIAASLVDCGASPDVASKMATRFGELAYPDGTVLVEDLVVDPPLSPVFAACREPNVGSEKELDASRMWVSQDDGLKEIEHAPFVVQNPEHWQRPWYDIVTRQSFGRWLSELTTHYSSRLEDPDEHHWREASASGDAARTLGLGHRRRHRPRRRCHVTANLQGTPSVEPVMFLGSADRSGLSLLAAGFISARRWTGHGPP